MSMSIFDAATDPFESFRLNIGELSSLSIEVKPSQAKQILLAYIAAGIPTMIWGPPAIGKSSMVNQTIDELGYFNAKLPRAIELDPVDLKGVPEILDGRTRFAPPYFLPGANDRPTAMFFDELNAGTRAVQSALLGLFLERRLGEFTLDAKHMIVAAGNRDSDGAHTEKLITPMKSRMGHINMKPDLEDWTRIALGGKPAVSTVAPSVPFAPIPWSGIYQPEVVAFCRFRRNLFYAFDKDSQTYPSPRTWEFVSRVLEQGLPPRLERQAIAGLVGHAAAVEFCAFLGVWRELPDSDETLRDPTGAPIPVHPSVMFAHLSALARAVTVATADNLFAYASRLSDSFSVVLVRDAIARCPAIQNGTGFIHWARDHTEVLA